MFKQDQSGNNSKVLIMNCHAYAINEQSGNRVFNNDRDDHTPLRFVTMCDNGVFNRGISMHLDIFPLPICK